MGEKFSYGKLFNILFHIGVVINVLIVAWVYLLYFDII